MATAAEGEARVDDAARRRSIEYLKCSADPAYFVDAMLVIDDAQGLGDGGGTTPFRLWPRQVDVLWTLMVEPRVIILKARQLGISWACCGYVLWRCLFHPGQMVLLFSRGQDDANEMLRRVRVLYERMPDWLRATCPLARPPNTSEMAWSNGSRVKSLPATKDAGSGWTASLVVLDEAAKLQFADDLYPALKPTVDGGGQLIVLSSASGTGNLFHKLWTRAVAGSSGFKAVFLPWWARPDRDRAWYDARLAEATDPNQVLQEYPSNPQECFLASGRPRFAAEWVDRQAGNVRVALLPDDLPDRLGSIPNLQVFAPPVPGRKYTIGADVAEGLEHGDYCDATVIDRETWDEVAGLHGRWEPDEYARSLMTLGSAYGTATIVPERNNHGHAVLATLKLAGYPDVGLGHDGRPGWLTNVQTKPQMIDLLATALRDGLIAVRTAAALGEMKVYRINNDGSTSAPGGQHDDMVMSRAIALIHARFARPEAVAAAVKNPLAGRRWGT
jgi:hypothetical protein